MHQVPWKNIYNIKKGYYKEKNKQTIDYKYLMIKSNSENDNIINPNNVDIIPCNTGLAICCKAIDIRLFRLPKAVLKLYNNKKKD